MSWLITGIEGFAGKHFFTFLKNKGLPIYGTTRKKEIVNNKNVFFLDLTDKERIYEIISLVKPKYLALIAGFSSQRMSFSEPELCMQVNYESVKHFLEAIRNHKLNTKVLLISSAMIYCPSQNKLTEQDLLCNSSPYVDSKIRAESLIDDFAEIDIVCSRSFNHIGTGQKETFLVPKIAKSFAKERSDIVTLSLGDIDSKRDFLDVKDISFAYYCLLQEATEHKIYNVCLSECSTIREIIKIMEEISKKTAKILPNPKFIGKNERPILWGDNSLLVKDTSWEPKVTLKETIKEVLDYYGLVKNP